MAPFKVGQKVRVRVFQTIKVENRSLKSKTSAGPASSHQRLAGLGFWLSRGLTELFAEIVRLKSKTRT